MRSSLNSPIKSFKNKRIWIIGASSGIGLALAQAWLAQGAYVAVSARRSERLLELSQQHPNALAIPLDASDIDAWQVAKNTLMTAWQGIDLIVFCAAIYQPERIWDVRSEQVRQTLAINFNSVYYGIETILPDLLTKGGGIAILSSVAGYLGLTNATVYGPSKAALINLAEILYLDLSPKGYGVYLINPGFVRTSLTAKNDFAMPALQTPTQAASQIIQGIQKGRFEIHFPKRFTLLLKIVQKLPYCIRLPLMSRFLK